MIAKVLGRLIWIAIAYIMACFAAGMTFVVSLAGAAGAFALDFAEIAATSFLVSSFVVFLAFAPAVVAVLIAEIFKIQSWIYYAIVGAAAAFLAIGGGNVFDRTVDETDARFSLFFLAPGLVAGLVYWLVAGRSAGTAVQALPDLSDR